MTVLRPRSRTISIRLSDQELSALRQVCRVRGARCISDLARDAMRDLLIAQDPAIVSASGRHEYSAQMTALEEKVRQLTEEVISLKLDRFGAGSETT